MPALVAGIHAFVRTRTEDVDGRVKPGHDGVRDMCDARPSHGVTALTHRLKRLNYLYSEGCPALG
jgi:hypothetical protein